MTPERIADAAARIAPFVYATPLRRVPHLDGATGRVFAKLECWQHTGSFKFRGATNKLLLHADLARERGVVTASTGNHGLAVSTAAEHLGCHARVFVPASADPTKLEGVVRAGAHVVPAGADCVDAERAAREAASITGALYVPPYNDPDVIAGQGTIGMEIRAQLGRVPDAVVVALGGGGLIGGIGTDLKHHGDVRVVAASPERSPALHECLNAGAIIDVPCHETLSDGTAGGVEAGSITFELCRRVVDESRLVEEDSIAAEMRGAIDRASLLVEGAAGVAFAIARQIAASTDGDVVVIACGGNVSTTTLRRILG